MKRLPLLIFIVCAPGLLVKAQQTWFEFEVSKKIAKNLELTISPEFRFQEKLELKEYFFDSGLDYKIFKYISLGAGYRLGNNIKNSGKTETFGRFAFDAKTQYEWKNFEAQLRLRYTNSDDFADDGNDKTNYLRMRLKFDYSIKKLNLKPYFAYEIYRDVDENDFTKARFETGLKYKINKHHRVGAYFRSNDNLIKDKSVNIIGAAYQLKL
jgi:hypothetical protein